MGNLADMIERYIRAMLESAHQDTLELQRQELARRFDCVPSQINYVLSTRFTADKGYVVESRRGGGGFIRIARVRFSPRGSLVDQLKAYIGDGVTAREAEGLLSRLLEEGLVNLPSVLRVKSAMQRELEGLPDEWVDKVRARMLRALLDIMFGGDFGVLR